MKYEDLINAHRKYHKVWPYDDLYDDARKIGWERIGEEWTAVFSFLNSWGRCRVEYSKRFPEVYTQCMPYIKALKDERLEYVDFNKIKVVNDERLRISHVIHHVFDVLMNEVGGRFGAVATSKLLHIALPDLFVMWDNAISNGYDVKMTGYSYAYKFMPRMKDELEEAIDDFIKHHPCSRDEAIGRIRKEANNESIPKLIDEYNWLHYTKQLI